MSNRARDEAKDRIVRASISLFSEKGFDGTRVNEIAKEAEVNKALIYYYFKNKEDILDYLIENLFTELTGLSLQFIGDSVVKMIKNDELDIKSDRFHFSDEEALGKFLEQADTYIERLIDYAIERRQVLRILMLESLKKRKHQKGLFRFMEMTYNSDVNPLYKTIKEADSDYNITDSTSLVKFFFGLVPIINFAAYYDDWLKADIEIDEMKLRSTFMGIYRFMMKGFVSDTDIMINGKLNGCIDLA